MTIPWHPTPEDPFTEDGAERILDAMLNGPVPPDGTMDEDELAAQLLAGSYEFVVSGCILPEPPEFPVAMPPAA
jgi:hypothetical protein